MLDGHDVAYWSEQTLRGIDTRAQLLDIEGVLQGDKYAQIRDIYLQRLNYSIAEKKGIAEENLFIDEEDDDIDESEDNSTDVSSDDSTDFIDDSISDDTDTVLTE